MLYILMCSWNLLVYENWHRTLKLSASEQTFGLIIENSKGINLLKLTDHKNMVYISYLTKINKNFKFLAKR